MTRNSGLSAAKRPHWRARAYALALALSTGAIALISLGRGGADEPADEAGQITPGFSSPVEAAAAAPTKLDYVRLDQRLGAIAAEPDMVGMAVAIVEGGRIRFTKGYGLTRADASEPVTPATVFRWASLSKGVAGTLAADLARDGKLSLDAPIAAYRTTLRLPGGAEHRVTVANVLAHRTGLVRNAYDEKLEEGQDPKAIRQALAALPAFCPPATCYTYQNIAFDAVSEAAEHATGIPYAELARTRVFGPLGMTSASVGRAGLEGAKSWARPHRGKTLLPTKDAYYRVPAAGGVNSSIFDLAKWMRAQMGLAALDAQLLLTTQTPLVATPGRRGGAINRALDATGYGLGWRTLNYAGHTLTGHRGAVDGYRSLILFDTAQKAGIAILWNSNSNKPVGMQLELLDMLYGLPRQEWVKLGAEPGGAKPVPADNPALAKSDGGRRGMTFDVR